MKWILDAWDELLADVIKKSFTSWGLSIPFDGSEDDTIHCFKEGQPHSTGLAVLKSQLDILDEPESPFNTEDRNTRLLRLKRHTRLFSSWIWITKQIVTLK